MDNEGLIFRGGKNMALLPMLLFIVPRKPPARLGVQ